MKKLFRQNLLAACACGFLISAAARAQDEMPPSPPDMASPPMIQDTANGENSQQPNQNQPSAKYKFVSATNATPDSSEDQSSNVLTETQNAFVPPAEIAGTNADELRLNFNNVPLEMVLNYLSDAAGFIIVMDTPVHGNVSVISSHPMTRDEAVDLLNSVLNQNGYAAIRNGRTLTIVSKDDAKTRDIPVKVSNDPNSIPKNDEIVTQIIPVRFVDASQLVSDLSSFVSPQATIVANQAGNSIVVTDTQENIRHLVEIIEAIDLSAAGETEIRVFPLQFANPNDVANELGEIFPSGNSGSGSGQSQMPIRFGGGGFFSRMMAANAGGNNSSSQNNRAQKQSEVTAVADPRTQSVIVTASKDLMTEISGMMEQLDVPSTRDQKVYVYHMSNGDPQQALQVLQGMFSNGGTSRGGASSSSQQTENSALINRANQNATTVGNTSSSISSGLSGNGGGGRGGGGGGQMY